jgi:hypothetical protein
VRGDTVLIHSGDTDAVARQLLTQTPAHDLEITSRGLEDAFIALTSDGATGPAASDGATGPADGPVGESPASQSPASETLAAT